MKFLAFTFLAVPLTFLVSLAAHASAPERGAREVAHLETDLDGDGKAEKVTVLEHPQDDGLLSLELVTGQGAVLRNDKLVYALDQDEEDVSTYHVSLKKNEAGALVISSRKGWGTSLWSYDYVVSFHDGAFRLGGFDYSFSRKEKHGSCSLNLVSGKAKVNGGARRLASAAGGLEGADGLSVEKICEELGLM